MKKKSEWIEYYFNITPDIAYFIDLEGRLQYWNAALEKLCGLPPEKMKGRSCAAFVCDQDKSAMVDDVQKVITSGTYSNTYRVIRSDGKLIPFHCNANITYNEFGEPDGFIGLGRDISDRMRAEDDLRESQDRYLSIFQNAPIGIFHSIPEGRFLTVNPAFATMLGYASPDELIECITNIETQVYCDPNMHVEFVGAIMKNAGWAYADVAFRQKDGGVISVRIKSRKVLNIDGTLSYFEGFADDITERKLSELALHESEEKYRGLFENAGDLAYGTDLNGNFTAVSESLLKVSGFTRNELINSSISKILTPDNLVVAQQMTKAKFEANIPVTRYELEITDKTGTQIPLELVSTLTYMNGVPVGIQGLGRDISERKRSELALQESIRKMEEKELSKSRFLAAAGHDLRQPLSAANLFIDALKFAKPTAGQNQIIQRLEQAMTNFKNLLDSLLNLSKLDAGIIKPEYTSVSLIEIFNWIDQTFSPLINNNQIRFKLHFPMKKLPSVRTDIGLLKSVLLNLITNAIKFTSEGGILVSARRRGNNILFQVWDTGQGISSENVKFIFDEFFQINNPQRDRTQGLGLGLYITKRALALFDGTITCRSEVGRGSVFEFLLPLATTTDGVTQPPPINASNKLDIDEVTFVSGKQFVVVEDDTLIAEALSNTLVSMGADVKLFHSADSAIDFEEIEKSDYYIVDYMLGGTLNGSQFLKQLRTKSGKPIRAVILTGDTSTGFVRESANFDWPVLHKPANIAQLLALLK